MSKKNKKDKKQKAVQVDAVGLKNEFEPVSVVAGGNTVFDFLAGEAADEVKDVNINDKINSFSNIVLDRAISIATESDDYNEITGLVDAVSKVNITLNSNNKVELGSFRGGEKKSLSDTLSNIEKSIS